MMIVHSKREYMAYVIGVQNGLRSTSEAIDQLAAQLQAARAELQQARAERAAMMAQAQEHIQKEAALCHAELTEALKELNQLRLTMFHNWKRTESDTVN